MSNSGSHLSDPTRARLDKSGVTWAYFSLQRDVLVDRSLLEELQVACREHDQPSLRLCLHADPQATFHEMVIAERRCSYYPPHMHREKDESRQILDGCLAAVLFEDDGRIRGLHIMETSDHFLLRLPKGTYHFYLPLTEDAVSVESKLGPYAEEDTIFAPWAPSRTDRAGAETFKDYVRTFIDAHRGAA